ncbi:MAG: hypothetical protein VZQ98_01720 [Bacteroidales bacterium]|nr:hypothetical protein [Bacteroidales bacterium]
MENKIIKYVYFVVFLLLAVSCDSLSSKKELCDKINPDNVTTLKYEYDICSIKRRNDYYMIYNPEGNRKIIVSLKNDRFYYKNYYSIRDSMEINAIVDVLRIIDKYKVYELYILDSYHYYIFKNRSMIVYQPDIDIKNNTDTIKLKDNWYYYERD